MAADLAQGVLVVAGQGGETPAPAVRELLGLARRLADAAGGQVAVALFADADADLERWAAYGVDRIARLRCDDPAALLPEAQLDALAQACGALRPAVVLLEHQLANTEIAPRLAFRLQGAAAIGCIDIARGDGAIRVVRPCYGGLAREEGEFDRTPLVATVRAGVFERVAAQPGRQAELVEGPAVDVARCRTRRVERQVETAGVRLEDATVIVAGGRGLEGPQGFDVLAELAQTLRGTVGASRVPCDLGWCPHSWQIGLTGKTVTPELYIAIGISGAGQHMAGCGNAKAIVAINSDPEAAIFREARFGVVGDYREVVPALIAHVRRLKQASAKTS
jgi:electron transfer flavoprotein alpha subunit